MVHPVEKSSRVSLAWLGRVDADINRGYTVYISVCRLFIRYSVMRTII